jgi:hypothetical protein
MERNRDDVRLAARGRIPDLVLHYRGRIEPPARSDRGRVSCPVHGGDGFNAAYSTDILTCFSGCSRTFDAFALVAACEGLSITSDFPQIVERTAAILGATPPTVSRPIGKRERVYPDRDVAALWDRLARTDRASESYLESRGLLLHDPDLLRYSVGGAGDSWVDKKALAGWRIGAPLRDREGIVRDIGFRSAGTPPDISKKVLVLPGVPTKGLAYCRPLPPEPPAEVVITEGLTDTLGAVIMWPDSLVLGAPGAGMALSIVWAFEDLIRGRRVIVALDNDSVGEANAKAVIAAAWQVGAASVARGRPDVGKDLSDELAAKVRP